MAKKYGLVGVNDDESTCSICGRKDLKRVMWLVELDEDGSWYSDPFACGTTCGAQLLGQKANRVRHFAEGFESMLSQKRQKALRAHPDKKEAELLIEAVIAGHPLTEDGFFHNRMNDPRYKKARALQAKAWDEVCAEIVTVNL